jgi:hypothetical protein
MRTKIILRTIRLCVVILLNLFNFVIAEDLKSNPASGFCPVDSNRISEILIMISNHNRSNYEQIKTWQGKLEVIEDYIYQGARAEKVFKVDTDGRGEIPSKIRKHTETIIEFSLHAGKAFIHAAYSPITPLQYTDLETGRELGAKGVLGSRTAILTPDYQYDCTGDRMRNRVIVSRMAVKQARAKNSLACDSTLPPVYDPRKSFSAFGDHTWELFPKLVELIKQHGKFSVDAYDLKVEELKDGDISKYRVTLPSKQNLESQLYLFFTLVFRSDKGFNIISFQETDHNGRLLQNRTWEYDLVNGVYVASKMTQQDFDWSNGNLRHERIVTLKNQKVNSFIPEETFTYKNLGLNNSDKFIDNILDKEYTYQDGVLIEVQKGKK